MSELVSLVPVAAPLNAKIGTISVDESGYAPLLVGALGTHNSRGQIYDATPDVTTLFKDASVLQRMVKESALYGENGHPNVTGMNQQDAMARFVDIHEPNVCAHFSEVWLDPNFYKQSDTVRKGEIAIFANTAAFGAKKEVVADSFANPRVNLCFSIRCLTRNYMVGNTLHRVIVTPITFDRVYLPGIRHATKLNAPTNTVDRRALETSLEKMVLNLDSERLGDAIIAMEASELAVEKLNYAKDMFKELQQHLDSRKIFPTTVRTGVDFLAQSWK